MRVAVFAVIGTIMLTTAIAANGPAVAAAVTVDPGVIEAIKRGEKRSVKAALRQGLDPNARDSKGQSLLSHATIAGHLEMVHLLLASRADVRAPGNERLAFYAVAANRLDLLKAIVDAGAPVVMPKDTTGARLDILVTAVQVCDRDVVEYLVLHGADVSSVEPICGETGFSMASILGRTDLMSLLLKAGSDINHKNCNGMTPLMVACFDGKEEIVKFLLLHGADCSLRDNEQYTAGAYATQSEVRSDAEFIGLCEGKNRLK